MGIKAVSLPDEMIKEIEDGARERTGGNFSMEIRRRLENEKGLRAILKALPVGMVDALVVKFGLEEVKTTDGASVETGPMDEIAGRKEISEFEGKVREAIESVSDGVKEDIKNVVDDLMLVGRAKAPEWFVGEHIAIPDDEKKAKAEKIASVIPGVVKASELPTNKLTLTLDEKQAEFMGNIISNADSPKKRGKGAKSVVMTKGFYREEFVSPEEAEKEAVKLGWVAGEYRIEDIV